MTQRQTRRCRAAPPAAARAMARNQLGLRLLGENRFGRSTSYPPASVPYTQARIRAPAFLTVRVRITAALLLSRPLSCAILSKPARCETDGNGWHIVCAARCLRGFAHPPVAVRPCDGDEQGRVRMDAEPAAVCARGDAAQLPRRRPGVRACACACRLARSLRCRRERGRWRAGWA